MSFILSTAFGVELEKAISGDFGDDTKSLTPDEKASIALASNVLVSAIEGGVGYWASMAHPILGGILMFDALVGFFVDLPANATGNVSNNEILPQQASLTYLMSK